MLTKFFSLVLLCGLFLYGTPASALSKEYVGVLKCKMCHNKPATGAQYTKWAASPHAKAFQSLKGDEAKNPKCLKCHATAFGLELSDTQSITMEEGVSCESCHGAGSAYKSAGIMKDQAKSIAAGLVLPDEKLCKKCHNPESPNYKTFDYKTYSAKIAHPNPAKEK
ncbi:MAG: cytochrome c family protein [Mariniphaga sp.]